MSFEEMLSRIQRDDPTLKDVVFSSGDYTSVAEMKQLAKALDNNTHVESLSFHNNFLGDKEVIELCKTKCRSLKHLNFELNKITDEGLIEGILKIKTLVSLTLDKNGIGDRGATAIAQSNIQRLSLNHNQVGNEGLRSLLRNFNITHLFINGNNFDMDGLKGVFLTNHIIVIEAKSDKVSFEDHDKVLAYVKNNQTQNASKTSFIGGLLSGIWRTISPATTSSSKSSDRSDSKTDYRM